MLPMQFASKLMPNLEGNMGIRFENSSKCVVDYYKSRLSVWCGFAFLIYCLHQPFCDSSKRLPKIIEYRPLLPSLTSLAAVTITWLYVALLRAYNLSACWNNGACDQTNVRTSRHIVMTCHICVDLQTTPDAYMDKSISWLHWQSEWKHGQSEDRIRVKLCIDILKNAVVCNEVWLVL